MGFGMRKSTLWFLTGLYSNSAKVVLRIVQPASIWQKNSADQLCSYMYNEDDLLHSHFLDSKHFKNIQV